MKYDNITEGKFIERPNRFIAYVEINGKKEKVHVKNTGRCREILIPGATVYLVHNSNPTRSTYYDLVAVKKQNRIINIDSQAPNAAVKEWLCQGGLFSDLTLIRPETVYKDSRFDFYLERGEEKILLEVKGVTLENNGVVSFPDAPSERAVKHVGELIDARKNGYRAVILFVIQMKHARMFMPAGEIHRQFAEKLAEAKKNGVEILAYDCEITEDSMNISEPVPVRLKEILRFDLLSSIPNPLLRWYDENRRILPWREEPTPYRVWVSEIMLQQTRVEAVKPYFERFMGAFPDIESLAGADEQRLLKYWEGLGYYNRARNLKNAAIQIMNDYGGEMPDAYSDLMKLKGIGSYTAGAVASIAYGKCVPAVDGNVLRVLSRVRMDDRLISDPRVKVAVEQELQEVIPSDRPGAFNQAMMEIGACVCIPNGAPLCGKCPLSSFCLAYRENKMSEYPKKEKKKDRSIEQKTVLVIKDDNRIAIRKRPDKGLLAGMYELPQLSGFLTSEEIIQILSEAGLHVIRIQPLEDAKHIFTHKEWHMKGYLVRVDELEPPFPTGEGKDWLYADIREIKEKYPIPAAFTAYSKYVDLKSGMDGYKEV